MQWCSLSFKYMPFYPLIIESGIHVDTDGATKKDVSEWNFPSTLLPSTNRAATEDGVIYDIVSHTFMNSSRFVARYTAPANSRVFDHNGG